MADSKRKQQELLPEKRVSGKQPGQVKRFVDRTGDTRGENWVMSEEGQQALRETRSRHVQRELAARKGRRQCVGWTDATREQFEHLLASRRQRSAGLCYTVTQTARWYSQLPRRNRRGGRMAA